MRVSGVCPILLFLFGTAMADAGLPVAATAMLADGEIPMLSSIEMDGKPPRPRLFQSPDQIKTYLESLGKYYTFHNRNRFGKRGRSRNPGMDYSSLNKEPLYFETRNLKEYEM